VSARLPDRPKYQALAGSERGHSYPFAHSVAGIPALIPEGEPDALLAWQEVGHLVNVLTVGGASSTPRPDALTVLDACPAWCLAPDHDRAGNKAAKRFAELARYKCRRLVLPRGKDLTEYHQSGGDLAAWLAGEWTRFGWPWPSRPLPTWRERVDGLPHDLWVWWRNRTTGLLAAGEQPATVEMIHRAEERAYFDLRLERSRL
jgi:hypothetical protein